MKETIERKTEEGEKIVKVRNLLRRKRRRMRGGRRKRRDDEEAMWRLPRAQERD